MRYNHQGSNKADGRDRILTQRERATQGTTGRKGTLHRDADNNKKRAGLVLALIICIATVIDVRRQDIYFVYIVTKCGGSAEKCGENRT